MKNVLYILAALLLTVSCTKHEDLVDVSFQPGNILLTDGRVIHPSLYNANEHKAIGVIFWCNDGSGITDDLGYAVALEDLEEDYLVDTTDDISSVTESQTEFDGESNTAGIITFAMKDSIPCPAAEKAINYNPGMSGWYIASLAQSKAISQSINKVYEGFDKVGGKRFSGWYWTSTENGAGAENPQISAFVVSLDNGSAGSSSKQSINKIRPIITIR